jgi:hypothetical protein
MGVRVGDGFRLSRHVWIDAPISLGHTRRDAAHQGHAAVFCWGWRLCRFSCAGCGGSRGRADKAGPGGTRCKNAPSSSASHVWMAPAPQEILLRVEQLSLAVMCPARWCSPDGLLALMGSANRGLITRAGSMSR